MLVSEYEPKEVNMNTTLQERGKEIAKIMRSSSIGPLHAASMVKDLADNWAIYKSSTNGISCTQWCKKTLGFDYAFFARRHEFVEKVGTRRARLVHHKVAVWLLDKCLTEEIMTKSLEIIALEALRNNGHPIGESAARRVLRSAGIIGDVKSHVIECPNCGTHIKTRETGGRT